MDYLPGNGYFDVAYKMLTQPESPGWLHMVQSAKSTMSESINLNGPGSGHHPYGAYIGFWLYKYLGGIRADEDQAGFPGIYHRTGIGLRARRSLYILSFALRGDRIGMEKTGRSNNPDDPGSG